MFTQSLPSCSFSIVVKFHGSLIHDPSVFRTAVAELERLVERGHRILVVPGGDLHDKAIERVDNLHPLPSVTTRRGCALVQDEPGYLLANRAFSSKLVPSATLSECRSLAKVGKIPVLLASRMLFTTNSAEWSWDITSDAVAAWIAWVTNAPLLAILTDIDGVYRNAATHDPEAFIEEIDAHDLAELGHASVDACAAHFMSLRGAAGVVINGTLPNRLRDWTEGKHVRATYITTNGGVP
ncbi:aspartate kinase (plasmid) [Rhizobium sp. CB3060]|uniref:amino acid kinase family protein n=1 Tax=Rhizobium sp. CB3060 TaxID=3138255 RepID=UPI0021A46D40|nr:aspartate kinase [Rhizobium tropici]UWU25799.1 aspartate kinase [Rhizobium tropici]